MSFDTDLDTGDIMEFTDIDPLELHLVPAGANGFAPLLAKSTASDVNNRTTTKEIDMTPNELIKLLDERDRAKKALKKAKVRKGTSESALIKQLQDRIAALENQPTGRLAAINGLASLSGVRAVRRGEGSSPFAALEKAIAEAETPKERLQLRNELTKAKILANAHIHAQSLQPGQPVPLISQPPDAYANARGALGHRS